MWAFVKEEDMAVQRKSGGAWRWGTSGKEYTTKEQAEEQGKAIRENEEAKKTKQRKDTRNDILNG